MKSFGYLGKTHLEPMMCYSFYKSLTKRKGYKRLCMSVHIYIYTLKLCNTNGSQLLLHHSQESSIYCNIEFIDHLWIPNGVLSATAAEKTVELSFNQGKDPVSLM